MLLVSPAGLNGPADALKVVKRLRVQRKIVVRPEHSPLRARDLPRAPRALEVPLVDRIVPAAAPTHAVRKAAAHHGGEDHVRDPACALAALAHSKLV